MRCTTSWITQGKHEEQRDGELEINVDVWMVNIERFEQELVKSDPEVEIEEWMYDWYLKPYSDKNNIIYLI